MKNSYTLFLDPYIDTAILLSIYQTSGGQQSPMDSSLVPSLHLIMVREEQKYGEGKFLDFFRVNTELHSTQAKITQYVLDPHVRVGHEEAMMQ